MLVYPSKVSTGALKVPKVLVDFFSSQVVLLHSSFLRREGQPQPVPSAPQQLFSGSRLTTSDRTLLYQHGQHYHDY